MSGRELDVMQLTTFMGLRFLDQPPESVADLLIEAAVAGTKQEVFFVNAHCVNVAAADPAYRDILAGAPYVLADGVGVAIASRFWGLKIEHNLNGTDLFPVLCEKASKANVTFAFLGGKGGIAKECAKRIVARHPGLQVVWVEHGYLSPDQETQRIRELNSSGAGMLFVAKGVPAQEHWIHRHAGVIDVPVLMGVGALFDFYSGAVPRAPLFLRNLRLEWLFRLAMEPARMFSRYVIGNPLFLVRALTIRITGA